MIGAIAPMRRSAIQGLCRCRGPAPRASRRFLFSGRWLRCGAFRRESLCRVPARAGALAGDAPVRCFAFIAAPAGPDADADIRAPSRFDGKRSTCRHIAPRRRKPLLESHRAARPRPCCRRSKRPTSDGLARLHEWFRAPMILPPRPATGRDAAPQTALIMISMLLYVAAWP